MLVVENPETGISKPTSLMKYEKIEPCKTKHRRGGNS
jgi:hypothetical protein